MGNMLPENIIGDSIERVLQHFNSTPRTVYVTELETPFPAGKLIVSRTDLAGCITHMNQAFVDMSGYSEEELIGQPHAILRHPDMPNATVIANIRNGEMMGLSSVRRQASVGKIAAAETRYRQMLEQEQA